QPDPVGALQAYLREVLDEARRRGYRFDAGKIGKRKKAGPGLIPVSRKQLDHEFHHLKSKLKTRAPAQYQELAAIRRPRP
ncbi:MAG: DNA lyase, partial [Nitrospinaceae bacterium]|nr:DNA lyase [Nitrospinaceae bacterium]NIR56547.1 DNA lyase [Nitrospinaceae bacterium]NIS87006.1 DNA lyase [Nitrospinaceae bacterium]NIT83848.1 DNA lyase [Nitrospinaceae bacterium]NIU46056.1 DNA lyase [Nitrospinaceae bacterium]